MCRTENFPRRGDVRQAAGCKTFTKSYQQYGRSIAPTPSDREMDREMMMGSTENMPLLKIYISIVFVLVFVSRKAN